MLTFLAAVAAVVVGAAAYVTMSPQFGDGPAGERMRRIERSENYVDGEFRNPVHTEMSTDSASMLAIACDFIKGNTDRYPSGPLPSVALDASGFGQDGTGLQIAWSGHSTVLIGIDGHVVLTDPVFSDKAGPLPLGPTAFDYENRIVLDDLPDIDVVVISHDHYDHLDYETIMALKDRVDRFFVPLGVGARLEGWGIPLEMISELDWWEAAGYGDLRFTAAPARHFSGRGVADGNETLWASWAIEGLAHSVFYSGDSGYFDGFSEIGDRLGPFDIAVLESGAYDDAWAALHMKPEETVQAALDLRSSLLMPIHWAKFNLALHPWDEPVERLIAEAARLGVRTATPRPGESFEPALDTMDERWWAGLTPRTGKTARAVADEVPQ